MVPPSSHIIILQSPVEVAQKFASVVDEMIGLSDRDKPFTIALSGGSTPALLFRVLAEDHRNINWDNVHLFWGDERCVSPDDADSNYGMTDRILLNNISIPSKNIHRIRGEAVPEEEALRYSAEISRFTGKRNGLPSFSLVILGLGEDGHTASVFPDHIELFDSEKICEVAAHPVTGQKRITITGRIINNAENIAFLVTGRKKAPVVEKMFKKDNDAVSYPAMHVVPAYGQLIWYLDKEAAGQ